MIEDIFIPGNCPSSKNSKQIVQKTLPSGKKIPFLIDSHTTQQYKKNNKIFYTVNRKIFQDAIYNITPPYYVGLYFIRDSARDFDLNNASQVVQDMAVDAGWMEDDCARVFVPVFLGYHVDKANAGVYIRVLDNDYSKQILPFKDYYKNLSQATVKR